MAGGEEAKVVKGRSRALIELSPNERGKAASWTIRGESSEVARRCCTKVRRTGGGGVDLGEELGEMASILGTGTREERVGEPIRRSLGEGARSAELGSAMLTVWLSSG